MTKQNQIRVLIGFVAAWMMAVMLAFLAGFLYAIVATSGHSMEFTKGIFSGKADALDVLLFVAGTVTVAAAIIAFVVEVVVAWPLYLVSIRLRRTSLRIYLVAGLLIALVVATTIVIFQETVSPQPALNVYWFEFLAIMVSGPASTLTLWYVVRPDR
jgi:hypothetical protein